MDIKHCPKCGSTNINSLIFYRPSTWKCLDCGYEGAFIIEGSELGEELQERYRKTWNIISGGEEEPRMDSWDVSFGNVRRTS
jgi:ribosomal protein L37AE/L43A